MDRRPKWERNVMWGRLYKFKNEGLSHVKQIRGCGCRDQDLNHVNKINYVNIGMRAWTTLNKFIWSFVFFLWCCIIFGCVVFQLTKMCVFFPNWHIVISQIEITYHIGKNQRAKIWLWSLIYSRLLVLIPDKFFLRYCSLIFEIFCFWSLSLGFLR